MHEVDRHRQRDDRAGDGLDPCARRAIARLLAQQENTRCQHDLEPGALVLEALVELPRAHRAHPRTDRDHREQHDRAERKQPVWDLFFVAAEQVAEHERGHVPTEDLELVENVQIDILRRTIRQHRHQDRMRRHGRRQHEQIHPPGLAEHLDPAVEDRRERIERNERIQIPEVHHDRTVQRRDELRPDGAGRERVRQKHLPQHGHDRPARERHDQPRQPVAQQDGNVGRFPARHEQIARHHEKQRHRRKSERRAYVEQVPVRVDAGAQRARRRMHENDAQRGENAQAVKVIHVRSFVQNSSLPAARKARLALCTKKRFSVMVKVGANDMQSAHIALHAPRTTRRISDVSPAQAGHS